MCCLLGISAKALLQVGSMIPPTNLLEAMGKVESCASFTRSGKSMLLNFEVKALVSVH